MSYPGSSKYMPSKIPFKAKFYSKKKLGVFKCEEKCGKNAEGLFEFRPGTFLRVCKACADSKKI